eukprot:evm.model.scf_1210.1 EVM.evm.TU.scf_1210.1   scf_1210:2327-2726(-)
MGYSRSLALLAIYALVFVASSRASEVTHEAAARELQSSSAEADIDASQVTHGVATRELQSSSADVDINGVSGALEVSEQRSDADARSLASVRLLESDEGWRSTKVRRKKKRIVYVPVPGPPGPPGHPGDDGKQ